MPKSSLGEAKMSLFVDLSANSKIIIPVSETVHRFICLPWSNSFGCKHFSCKFSKGPRRTLHWNHMETIQSVSITRIPCGKNEIAVKLVNGNIGALAVTNIIARMADYILWYTQSVPLSWIHISVNFEIWNCFFYFAHMDFNFRRWLIIRMSAIILVKKSLFE